MTTGPYSRIYHSIVDDPKFERVYENDHALATWLRMLLVADAMYPVSAPMPHRNPSVRLLIDCGLIVPQSLNRYAVKGLRAEREHRSDAARNAAAMRWQSKGNADAMPRRDETRQEEKSSNANASFLGYRPKPGSHEGQHPAGCLVCHPDPVKQRGAA